MLFPHHIGKLIPSLFPNLTWQRETEQKTVYLTFDDGPVPEITDFVLQELTIRNAKATFFCVGENIAKYPQIFEKILQAGHQVGNHTNNHINGWLFDDHLYFKNVELCQKEIDKFETGKYLPPKTNGQKKLFRPPYGKITRKQIEKLQQDYEIVMWTLLSGDFDRTLNPQKCLEKTSKYTENGTIVVFHDSIKAAKNLQFVLPKYLDFLVEQGYQFNTL
jgi:peptidoglycan/xylan/chitin deacetylase (PgdA/CDA1 family)